MKTWLKVTIVLLLLGLSAGVYTYFFVYNKPHKDYLGADTDVYIAAEDLYNAFISDPSEAADKYNGKILQINDILDNKELSDELVILVFTFSEGMFGSEGVRCTLHPEVIESAYNVTEGDFIKIKGLCTGFTGADVILDKCSIVE